MPGRAAEKKVRSVNGRGALCSRSHETASHFFLDHDHLKTGCSWFMLRLRSRPCSTLPSCTRAFSTSPVAHRRWWNLRNHFARRERDLTRIPKDRWQYNTDPFDGTVTQDQLSYPVVTANEIESLTEPPRQVKMLVRDFIEDSLYNPNYGYFPKQATIFESGADQGFIDFSPLRDSVEFQEVVGKRYLAQYGQDGMEGPGRQLWHTPTELFRPYYGQAIAKCLVSEYLLKYFPYEDFIIYEIGAGNGSLAVDILDFLKAEYPEVYERTQYHIIEISAKLASVQREKVLSAHPLARITNKSIFRWDTREPAPCYFLAMEVVDNFGHDLIRYDLATLQPYQGVVTISKDFDLDIIYQPISDPLITSFLSIQKLLGHNTPVHPILAKSPLARKTFSSLPFSPNMSEAEFIPTRLLSLLRTIRTYFPRHRLLLSDFSSLPDTIPGINAPVVQTRVQGQTVPTETLLVQPGWFDIFFPTQFDRLRDMYEYMLSSPLPTSSTFSRTLPHLPLPPSFGFESNDFFSSAYPSNRRRPIEGTISASGLPVGERKSSVFSHAEFLETYGDLGKTRLRNGENPMVEFYQNVRFLF